VGNKKKSVQVYSELLGVLTEEEYLKLNKHGL
jgi:hypothetical protein